MWMSSKTRAHRGDHHPGTNDGAYLINVSNVSRDPEPLSKAYR